jgi:hypothetical protein
MRNMLGQAPWWVAAWLASRSSDELTQGRFVF